MIVEAATNISFPIDKKANEDRRSRENSTSVRSGGLKRVERNADAGLKTRADLSPPSSGEQKGKAGRGSSISA
jgi:hypothetical protein